MEKTETIRELLKTMDQISTQMRDIIYFKYFDKLGNDKKYILSMMNDAFQTTSVFCYATQHVYLTQAGLLLRQLLEQVAISYILVVHLELLPKYVEHSKSRIEWSEYKKGEQINMIAEKYGVPNNSTALAYLDYGWINFDDKKKCGEDGMLEYAGFDDILSWRKKYLDKLAHTSFTSTNLVGPDGDYPIIYNFMQIVTKLFDHLCVAFHNLTGFDFIFDNERLFDTFRNLYSELYK